MGTKIVQHNIFGEMEEIRTKKTRKEVFEDYDGFVNKFKPKLTTDDCYTPQYVYDVIRDLVDENVIPLEGKRVVRIWNLDTFEGGKGSRTSFLKKIARRGLPEFRLQRRLLCTGQSPVLDSRGDPRILCRAQHRLFPVCPVADPFLKMGKERGQRDLHSRRRKDRL